MSDSVIVAVVGGMLGGSAVAALINQVGEAIRAKQHRSATEDKEEDAELKALKTGLKWVLYDRIRYLGLNYLKAEKIDFDDRRILNEMHKSYHDGLGGNGDLDNIMAAVNKLQLK